MAAQSEQVELAFYYTKTLTLNVVRSRTHFETFRCFNKSKIGRYLAFVTKELEIYT